MILTIGGTGIRVSELKFITVEALKNRKVQIHLKGKDRTILLPQKLRKKLNQYVKTQSIHQGPVFQTRSGKPLDRSNICHEMKEICQEADVDRKKSFLTIYGICSPGAFMRWRKIWRFWQIFSDTLRLKRHGFM